jgi:signal peptidase I
VTAAGRLLRAAYALVGLVSLVVFVALVGARVAHWSAAPVLTGSMTPTFRSGDLVITRQIDVRTLQAGHARREHGLRAPGRQRRR